MLPFLYVSTVLINSSLIRPAFKNRRRLYFPLSCTPHPHFSTFSEIALKLNSLLLWKEARVKNNWMWERTKGRLPFLRLQSPLRRWCRAHRIVLLSAAIPPSLARHSAPEKSLLMSDNQGEFSKSCHFQMTVYTLCGETASFSGRGGAPLVMHSERETPNGHWWGDNLGLGSEEMERGRE